MIFVNFLLNSRAEIFRFFFFDFLDFFGKVASDASRYFDHIIGLPQRQRHLYPAFLDVIRPMDSTPCLPRERQLGGPRHRAIASGMPALQSAGRIRPHG